MTDAGGRPRSTVALERWAVLAPMTVARSHAAVAGWGGRLYVFGGGGPGFVALNSAACYDPAKDTWTPIDTVDGGLQMLNRGPGPKSTVHVEDAFSIRR